MVTMSHHTFISALVRSVYPVLHCGSISNIAIYFMFGSTNVGCKENMRIYFPVQFSSFLTTSCDMVFFLHTPCILSCGTGTKTKPQVVGRA